MNARVRAVLGDPAELDAATLRALARAHDVAADHYAECCPCLLHQTLSAQDRRWADEYRTWAFDAKGGAVAAVNERTVELPTVPRPGGDAA